jgi:uroporphyrinogen decarboxylase
LYQYAQAIKSTGCQGGVMAEPAAGLLSSEDCWTYSMSYVQQLVKELQDSTFLIVLHNCGNTGHCTQPMLDTGAGACHMGNAVSMKDVLAISPKETWMMGNIDPVGVMKGLKPEEVFQCTKRLLEETANYPNFVLSTG